METILVVYSDIYDYQEKKSINGENLKLIVFKALILGFACLKLTQKIILSKNYHQLFPYSHQEHIPCLEFRLQTPIEGQMHIKPVFLSNIFLLVFMSNK